MSISEKAKNLMDEMLKNQRITSITFRDSDFETINSHEGRTPMVSLQKYACEIEYLSKSYSGSIGVKAYGDVNFYRAIYKILTFIKKQL